MHWIDANTVLGVFTHRETYVPDLRADIARFFPDVQFVEQNAPLSIRDNFMALLQTVRQIGKRFAIFLDDDIRFLDERTVRVAVGAMLNNRWAATTVYSLFDTAALTTPYRAIEQRLFAAYPPNRLVRTVTWMPGYFMAVDMHQVGHVDPDMNAPTPNIGHDTMYSMRILQAGGVIGVAPTVVYHLDKNAAGLEPWILPADAAAQREYAIEKYGPLYPRLTHYSSAPVVVDWQERLQQANAAANTKSESEVAHEEG